MPTLSRSRMVRKVATKLTNCKTKLQAKMAGVLYDNGGIPTFEINLLKARRDEVFTLRNLMESELYRIVKLNTSRGSQDG